jgi:hypothetical protein
MMSSSSLAPTEEEILESVRDVCRHMEALLERVVLHCKETRTIHCMETMARMAHGLLVITFTAHKKMAEILDEETAGALEPRTEHKNQPPPVEPQQPQQLQEEAATLTQAHPHGDSALITDASPVSVEDVPLNQLMEDIMAGLVDEQTQPLATQDMPPPEQPSRSPDPRRSSDDRSSNNNFNSDRTDSSY